MAQEIERKFLLKDTDFLKELPSEYFEQGYIRTLDRVTVRVRVAGERGYLTVKGPTTGVSRAEYEYPVLKTDAEEMLRDLCAKPTIQKRRYLVPYEGMTWEVDEFLGLNQGLFVAEIELSHESQEFALPPWAGEEVSGQGRYNNSALVTRPFSSW